MTINADTIPASKRAECGDCGKPVWKSKSSAPVPRCRDCRRTTLEHGRSGYRRGCRCATCRAGVAAAARERGRKLKAEGRKLTRPTVPATCHHCGEAFQARLDNIKTGGGKHCSIRCANYTKARQRGFGIRPPRKSAFRKRAERLAAKAAEGTSGGNRVWVQGDCIICSTPFMSPGAASRYCSTACREKNRNRLYGLTWLDRMALFERDNWTCHLCGLAVEYAASSDDPKYPTLDHIIPRSKGGSDDPSNLACCHSLCNSIRRDMPMAWVREPGNMEDLRKRIAA